MGSAATFIVFTRCWCCHTLNNFLLIKWLWSYELLYTCRCLCYSSSSSSSTCGGSDIKQSRWPSTQSIGSIHWYSRMQHRLQSHALHMRFDSSSHLSAVSYGGGRNQPADYCLIFQGVHPQLLATTWWWHVLSDNWQDNSRTHWVYTKLPKTPLFSKVTCPGGVQVGHIYFIRYLVNLGCLAIHSVDETTPELGNNSL